MLLAAEKAVLVKQHGTSINDTGSVEVQVALLTAGINKLAGHFKGHEGDHHSRRGLIRQVNLRRSLLQYLKDKNLERYRKLIADLKLRG